MDPNSPGFPLALQIPLISESSPGEDFDPKGAFGEKLRALLLQSQEMMKILEAGLQWWLNGGSMVAPWWFHGGLTNKKW